MTKREKVVKGLECCDPAVPNCDECPYLVGIDGECMRPLHADALALLKAQQQVEPTEPDEDNTQYCGACGSAVGYEVLDPSGMGYVKYNYCPECGKAVKWDG